MDDSKRCPYCGEEILAVAVKCKHCGSTIDGVGSELGKQLRIRGPFKFLGALLILAVGAAVIYNVSGGHSPLGRSFGDTDIEHIKQDIRAKFSERGHATIVDVEMMKESATKLTGYVKLKEPLLPEITKPCTATMGDGGQIIWECK